MLYAKQIKAARAMLGWGQRKFAEESGISAVTLRRLEAGTTACREKTQEAIHRVVEKNGLEFIEHEGIRTRPRGLLVFEGDDTRERVLGHLLQTVEQRGGEVLVISPTLAEFMQCFDIGTAQLDHFKKLSGIAPVKCILWDSSHAPSALAGIQFRMTSKMQAWPTTYFIYGDRLCFTVWDGGTSVRFIVVQSGAQAEQWSRLFFKLWESAPAAQQSRRRVS